MTLTDEQIQALAHRLCYHYEHSNDPDFRAYTFGKLTLLDFAQKLLSASIADTAGAKLSASNLPEEFRINDPADYKRTMDAQFPDAARPVAWRLRLQDGSLDYSNCEIEPSGADLKDATENGRVFEPLYLAATPAPSADTAGAIERLKGKSCRTGHYDICHAAKQDGVVCPEGECDIDSGVRPIATPASSVADTVGAEKDAKRWRYAYKHLIIGTQDTRNGFEEIDIEAIDAAIAKESGNDLE